MKTGKTNEAEYFTERIYPGFTSAFWTNHVYAIASIVNYFIYRIEEVMIWDRNISQRLFKYLYQTKKDNI